MTTSYDRYCYHHNRVKELAGKSEFLNSILRLNQQQLEQYIGQTMCHTIDIQKDSYLRSVLIFYAHVLSAWKGRKSSRDERTKRGISTDSGHEHQISFLDQLGMKCCSVLKYLQSHEPKTATVKDYKTDYTVLECEDVLDTVETPDQLQDQTIGETDSSEVRESVPIDEVVLQEMVYRTYYETCQYFCDISYMTVCFCKRTSNLIKWCGALIEKDNRDFLIWQIKNSKTDKRFQKRVLDQMGRFMKDIPYQEHGIHSYEQQIKSLCNNAKLDTLDILQLCKIMVGGTSEYENNLAEFLRDPVATTHLCLRSRLALILSIEIARKCAHRERTGRRLMTIRDILKKTPKLSENLKTKISSLSHYNIEEDYQKDDCPLEVYPDNINPYYQRYANGICDHFEDKELWTLCSYYCPDRLVILDPIMKLLDKLTESKILMTTEIKTDSKGDSRVHVIVGMSGESLDQSKDRYYQSDV